MKTVLVILSMIAMTGCFSSETKAKANYPCKDLTLAKQNFYSICRISEWNRAEAQGRSTGAVAGFCKCVSERFSFVEDADASCNVGNPSNFLASKEVANSCGSLRP